jgi:hypothetical protein
VVLDDVGGGLGAEGAGVGGGRDDGELFDDEPIETLALRLRTRHVVECKRVETSGEQNDVGGVAVLAETPGFACGIPPQGAARRLGEGSRAARHADPAPRPRRAAPPLERAIFQ